MADVHRRIELQEQDDLRYLINNVRRAANEKIDLALPPIEGEDALRRHVEELVHEYVSTTFQTASFNLSINGHYPSNNLLSSLISTTNASSNSSTGTTEEYEPLNDKLRSRAIDLTGQEEDLLMEIAALRREAPVKAAEMWRQRYKVDEEVLRTVGDGPGREVKEGGATGQEEVGLSVGKLERQEEIEKTWERGVEGLGRLKMEMPGTAAKMERAKRAGEYVLAER